LGKVARIARAYRSPPGWRLPIRFLAGADNPEAEATRPTTVHNNGNARGRTASPRPSTLQVVARSTDHDNKMWTAVCGIRRRAWHHQWI